LSLELYGQGWEENPKYARFAKGYIQYGEPLEELTGRAKINLQIIPYSCLHQRLLDGLTAGGFFLIRSNPLDIAAGKVGCFVREAVKCGARTTEQALEILSDNSAEEFRACLDLRTSYSDIYTFDCVAHFLSYTEEERKFIYQLPPHYEDIAFKNIETLERCLNIFLSQPHLRHQIQENMRNWIGDRYSYRTGWHRIMRQIGHLIQNETHEGQNE